MRLISKNILGMELSLNKQQQQQLPQSLTTMTVKSNVFSSVPLQSIHFTNLSLHPEFLSFSTSKEWD